MPFECNEGGEVSDWKSTVREQLKKQEGVKRFAYIDTVGKTTIGCGRNLTDKGLSKAEVELFLTNDIIDAEDDARRLLSDLHFDVLSETRKAVIVNMAFNLGYARLSRFSAMLGALKAGRYQDAAREMRNSTWATQVKGRAEELAGLMEKG
jgi:lysozyme